MKTFIIVDDELLVRVGLRSLADWEDSGYRIAGEAADGNEALELVRRLNPDLVLTDLVMPGMGGLELIERLRESGSCAGIVVLSCHNDFDNVREAMRKGADDYVFKLTLKKAELLEAFGRAASKRLWAPQAAPDIGAELQALSPPAYPTGSQAASRPTGAGPEGAGPAAPVRAFASIGKPFRVLALSFVGAEASEDLLRELGRHDDSVLAVATDGRHAWLALANGGRPSQEASFALAGEYARRYLGCGLLGAVSSLVLPGAAEPDTASARIVQADEALRLRCYGPGQVLTHAEDPAGALPEFHSEAYAAACMDLSRAIEASDPDRTRRAVESVADSLRLPMDESRLRSLLTDALVPFKLRARALGFDADVVEGAETLSDAVILSLSVDDAAQRVGRYAETFLRLAAGKSRLRREIAEVRRWVLADLARQYTVEAAAGIAGMSPSHFAHLFKEETGSSFIDFVNRSRMERAKELLLTSSLMVKEIADRLGFENPNYFCSLFKRSFGATPNEFREGRGGAAFP